MADYLPFPGGDIPDARHEFYTLGDGARLRYAVFEPDGAVRGTFLVAQGRREFIEKKYLEAGHDLRGRGFRVILFDWRGQGLSSRFFAGVRRQVDHVTDFELYTEDLRAFIRDIVTPRASGPLYILAHSMGGLIVTRYLADGGHGIEAAILTAPALAIGVPPGSYAMSRLAAKLGCGERYAAGQHDYDNRDRRFNRNVLSHDPARFAVIEKYFDANPELKVGGVTWGWLAVALKSIEQTRQPGFLERIAAPVLALCGGKDIVTPPVKTIPLLRRMPRAEVVIIRGARHDLMNEADHYRDRAWRHIDGFLERVTHR